MSATVDVASTPDGPAYVTYAEFGEQFFTLAVTTERVVGAVKMLAGQPIDIGPLGVGPGRLVKIKATGSIGTATGESLPGDTVSYRVNLPVELSFEVDLGVETHRFQARLAVPLVLAARALAGLQVVLDVTPPRADEIGIDLVAQGLRANVLQRVAGIEGEVRRFVAKYVARELEKPYVQRVRTIDVAAAIDMAWERLAPRTGSPTAERLAHDLEQAVETRWEGAVEDDR